MPTVVRHIDVGSELARTEWESDTVHELNSGTSFPGSPVEMDTYYRTDEHIWYLYDGSGWRDLMAYVFTRLADTPSSYTGAGGYFVRVNSTPDGLEFVQYVAVSDLNINASFIPTSTTYDLGSATYEWANLYLGSGRVYFTADQSEWIYSNDTNLFFGFNSANKYIMHDSGFTPVDANSRDLGGASNEWKDAYIQGTIKLFSDQAESIRSNGTQIVFEVGGGDVLKISPTEIYPNSDSGMALGHSSYRFQILKLARTDPNDIITMTDTSTNDWFAFRFTDGGELTLYQYDSSETTTTYPLYWNPAFDGTQSHHIEPTTSNNYDLGSSTKEWKDIYVAGQLKLYTDQAEFIYSDGSYMYFGIGGSNIFAMTPTEIRPTSDSSYDLGDSTRYFAYGYIDEILTETLTVEDSSKNDKFEIVYNADTDSLDFNFVG